MLVSPRKNGLTSLFKEVTVFKKFAYMAHKWEFFCHVYSLCALCSVFVPSLSPGLLMPYDSSFYGICLEAGIFATNMEAGVEAIVFRE